MPLEQCQARKCEFDALSEAERRIRQHGAIEPRINQVGESSLLELNSPTEIVCDG